MTMVFYQGKKLPTRSCLLQYILNQPPVALLQLESHTYIPVEPGNLIEVKIAPPHSIDNHWLIESTMYDGTHQIIHAVHPVHHLTYERGTQPFYQMAPLQLLQNMLTPLSITLQHKEASSALLKKIPLCFKYQTESNLDFLNWLCDLAQTHWACQLDHHVVQLMGKSEKETAAYQLTHNAQEHCFSNAEQKIASTLKQCIWSKKSPHPSLLLHTPFIPIALGAQVDCQYQTLCFTSTIQAIHMEITWENKTAGEISQTLCLSPLTILSPAKTYTPHPELIEAITEGISNPTLDPQGKQAVRFLLDESSANDSIRKQSPIDTMTPFSQTDSAFQAPIPALQHVLTLSAMHRQSSYLLGGLYQSNQPSPQSIETGVTNQLLFPKQYGLTITEESQQTLTLRDEKNGLSLTFDHKPHLNCQLKNANQAIYFLSNHYQCLANGLSTTQADQKITWMSEEIRLHTRYYNNQSHSKLNITTDIFYQSVPHQSLSCTDFNAQVQQHRGKQDTWHLLSKGSLRIKSNSITLIEAKQTIMLKTPSATISLSANEINLSSLALDFSSGLLTLAGKICFHQSNKISKKPQYCNKNERNAAFTNSEKSRYDENATLIDAFVFYQ